MNVCLLLSRILGSRKDPPVVTYTLSGTITGDEVEGVTLTLTGDASDSTTSAADGTYSFTGLSNGDYNVEPSLAGYTFAPTDTDVTISGADDTGNDFVSTEIILLPQYIEGGWQDGVSVPVYGAQPANDWADASDPALSGITNIATPEVFGHTPSQNRSIRLDSSGEGDAKFYRIAYAGFENDGLKFDKSLGLRFMVLCARRYTVDYTRIDIGVTDSSRTNFFRANFSSLANPDTTSIRETFGVYDNQVSGNCPTNLGATQEAWVAVGIEIPAGFSGTMSSRCIVFTSGGASGVGSASRSIVQDWSAVDVTRVEAQILKDGAGVCDINWMWVGTASDEWPI